MYGPRVWLKLGRASASTTQWQATQAAAAQIPRETLPSRVEPTHWEGAHSSVFPQIGKCQEARAWAEMDVQGGLLVMGGFPMEVDLRRIYRTGGSWLGEGGRQSARKGPGSGDSTVSRPVAGARSWRVGRGGGGRQDLVGHSRSLALPCAQEETMQVSGRQVRSGSHLADCSSCWGAVTD